MAVPSIFLKGPRLSLRLHTEADLPTWAAWFNDSEVTTYLEQAYFPNTIPAQAERLKSLYSTTDHLQLAIMDNASQALVGTVGLHHINPWNRNADISIVVGNRDYWGKKYGQEAVSLMVRHGFEKLNLHKLTAGMVASNEASFRLFQELGFHKEAELREQLFIQGRYQDLWKMALFKAPGRERT